MTTASYPGWGRGAGNNGPAGVEATPGAGAPDRDMIPFPFPPRALGHGGEIAAVRHGWGCQSPRLRLPTPPLPLRVFSCLPDNVPSRVVSRLRRRRWRRRRLLLRMLRKTGALGTLEVWGMEKEMGLGKSGAGK